MIPNTILVRLRPRDRNVHLARRDDRRTRCGERIRSLAEEVEELSRAATTTYCKRCAPLGFVDALSWLLNGKLSRSDSASNCGIPE